MERRSVLEQVVRHFLCEQLIFKYLYQTPLYRHSDAYSSTLVPLFTTSGVVSLRSKKSSTAVHPIPSQTASYIVRQDVWCEKVSHNRPNAQNSNKGPTFPPRFSFRSWRTTGARLFAAGPYSSYSNYCPVALHLQQSSHGSTSHSTEGGAEVVRGSVERPNVRHPKTRTVREGHQEMTLLSNLSVEKFQNDTNNITGIHFTTKASVKDGQSVLKLILEKRVNLPVPNWASKIKAWRLDNNNHNNNGNLTASLVYPHCGNGGSLETGPDPHGRRDAQSEYVPLLHRLEFRSAVTNQEQGNAAQADLDGFRHSFSVQFDTDPEEIAQTVETPKFLLYPPKLVHSDIINTDLENDSRGCKEKKDLMAKRGRSSTGPIIFDSVEWLSKASDFPLMDPEIFSSYTHLTAQELHSPSYIDSSTVHMPSEVNQDADNPNGASRLEENALAGRVDVPSTSHKEISTMVREAVGDRLRGEGLGAFAKSQDGIIDEDPGGIPESSVGPDPTVKSGSKPLLFNVFTRRVVTPTSASVRGLSLIGITLDDGTRELAVKDPAALRAVAMAIRQKRLSWPKAWSRGALYAQLKYIMLDESLQDPAEKVEGLLRAQYQRLRDRQSTGVVVHTASEDMGNEMIGQSPSSQASDAIHSKSEERFLSIEDLSEEQQEVIGFVLKGYHTYIGGGAGTGKSSLLHVLKHRLRQEGLRVAVTSTTGVASSHIGGCTLHHCFGINLHGDFTRREELSSYDAIIIDEISMLPRGLFETLEWQLRRSNGVNLPFGGVQMILCGDFMQLGAIAAEPIIHSPLFRSNFAMLKLMRVIRQGANPIFALQLQVLRRGLVPQGLENTVQLISTKQRAEEARRMEQLKERQRAQLQAIAILNPSVQPQEILPHPVITASNDIASVEARSSPLDETSISRNEVGKENSVAQLAPPSGTGGSHVNPPLIDYVEDAVNLFPTNKQVQEANLQELAKLPGEVVVYSTQVLTPTLLGTWSPTYLLQIKGHGKPNVKKIALEIKLYISVFFEKVKEWDLWWKQMLVQQDIVLYFLFADALALRVRIPHGFDGGEALLTHLAGLVDHLSSSAVADLGVQVREILLSPDGLHTEADEYILDQYAAHAPVNASLALKVGARVMLRANLAPGLVNGSLGTVVGFREPPFADALGFSQRNSTREEVLRGYVDFLRYEHGVGVAMLPEVDFGDGRVELIFPVSHRIGGFANTHHYGLSLVALPLTLAYAFTVHKVQGLTLVGRVHLELARMWPCEHLLYVAMSRVRNPNQLSISNFDDRLVCAAADCLVFDDSLPSVRGVRLLPHFFQATWYRVPTRRKKALRKKELERIKQKRNQKTKEKLCKDAERIISEISSITDA
ncbi:unnamed protein product [Phytomonas sp. Hart1]|nr:unnamed protein product [Phytomonas sp. Hart1]|eukprot:CCW67681.1 unnamed protein product [Phytomonas sp. isolate Hart1]